MDIDFNIVIDLIRDTRSLTLPHFGKVSIKDFKSENATDAVTQIDQDVERFIKNRLAQINPSIGFVGEEFGGDHMGQRFWILDPIDGTGCYIRGLPYCSTMLALIENGLVTKSIIYDFVQDKVFHAERGKGAYCNGERIHVSHGEHKSLYVSLEMNTKLIENQELFFAIRNSIGHIAHLSAGYEFTLVASGVIDGRIVYKGFGKDYDFAPGTLLVEEAGGIIRNFGSTAYDYKDYNFVAVSPYAFERLMQNQMFADAMGVGTGSAL